MNKQQVKASLRREFLTHKAKVYTTIKNWINQIETKSRYNIPMPGNQDPGETRSGTCWQQ